MKLKLDLHPIFNDSASIERSIRPGSSLLGTTSGRVEIGCSSIDLWTPVVGVSG